MKVMFSLLGVVALAAIYYLGTYSSLVARQEAVNAAWGKVEVVCQRRAELIPNLVATVQGYASHEKDLFVKITEARAKAGSINISGADLTKDPELLKKFLGAQNELSGALNKLLAVREAYPDLKASEGFRTLQVQIEGSENRISVERTMAQNATQSYNTLVRGPIARYVAGDEFKVIPYFVADESSKTAPVVKF